MSAWVCLPRPTGCSATARDTAILGARNSFGMCVGECVFDLTITANTTSEPPCDRVRLAISGRGGLDPVRTNLGLLTPLAHARVTSIAAALLGTTLAAVYGCPDCADGGASEITLSRTGLVTSHQYEYENPPPPLADADALVQAILSGLRTCQSNEQVEIDSGCTP